MSLVESQRTDNTDLKTEIPFGYCPQPFPHYVEMRWQCGR